MPIPELVAVQWNDAHGSDGTISAHEIDHKPYVFTTVGYLVRTDEQGVSLAHERGEDGMWRQVTFVPRLMILNEWPLGPLNGLKKRKKKVSLPDTPPPV